MTVEEMKAMAGQKNPVQPIVKPENSYDAFKNQAKNLEQKAVLDVNVEIEKSKGSTVNFSKYDKNLEKLQSYGTKYQMYGYNPKIDNEKLYDDNTSTLDQWNRSYTGMMKLTNIALKDNFLFGAFGDKNSHTDFEHTIDTYSSKKGGVTGFAQNLLLNSGYTVGIIADMVVEEAVLAGLTVLSGGTAAPGTGAVMAAKGVSAFNSISKAFSGYKTLQNAIRIGDTAKDISRMTKFGNKAAKLFNPVSNVTDFAKGLKNIDKLRDATQGQKIIHGLGAAYRDIKAAHLTYSEATLESNILKDDVYKGLIDQHEGQLTDADLTLYKQRAEDAAMSAKLENIVAIGATNKLVFDNMYKTFDNMKGLGRVFRQSYSASLRGDAAKGTLQAVQTGLRGLPSRSKLLFKDGFKSGMLQIGKNIKGSTGGFATANIGEGIQELSQEAIASKNKHMYGSEVAGTYFDSLLSGLKDQMSAQGGETFLSGFLMGGIMSPVNYTVKKAGDFIKVDHKFFTDNSSYRKSRNAELIELQNDANHINELFKTPGDVFTSKHNTLTDQSDLSDQMVNASARGDQYDFQNAKGESYRKHLHSVMKNDMMDDFVDHLESFKSMNAEEFKQAYPSTGKDLSSSERNAIIDSQVKKAKIFKEHYNNVQTNIINPFIRKNLDPQSDEYKHEIYSHAFFEKAKDELIFSRTEIEDNLSRKESLMNTVKDEVEAHNIPFFDYQKLFDEDSITHETKLLQDEVKALSGIKDEKFKQRSTQLKHLTRFKESLDEMDSVDQRLLEINNQLTISPAEKKELKKLTKQKSQATTRLQNRYNEYLKTISQRPSGIAFENMSKNTFDKLHDYYRLDKKNKELDQYVNMLINPQYTSDLIRQQVSHADVLMKEFHEYTKNSLAAFRDKAKVDNTLNSLYQKGIGFDLIYLDDLIDHGVIPTTLFDLETDTELSHDDPKYLEGIEELNNLVKSLLIEPTSIAEEEAVQKTYTDDGSPTEITLDTPIESYNKELLNDLIKEYKLEVVREDLNDPLANQVSMDNLTDKFVKWVHRNGQKIVTKYNQQFAKITDTFDSLSKGDKDILIQLGYDNVDQINDMSIETVDKLINDFLYPQETTAPVEVKVEDTFDDILAAKDELYQNTVEALADTFITYAQQQSNEIGKEAFNVIRYLELNVLNRIGSYVLGHQVSIDLANALIDKMETFPGITKKMYSLFKEFSTNQINNFEQRLTDNIINKNNQSINQKLLNLEYTQDDIDGFSVALKNDIVTNNISKENYLVIQSERVGDDTKLSDSQSIDLLFKNLSFNIRSVDELNTLFGDLTLSNHELFGRNQSVVDGKLKLLRSKISKLSGFANVMLGDVVEMKSGDLLKVVAKTSSSVSLVEYNNILQDKRELSKTDFNRENKLIINDFNKDRKGLSIKLEKGNVDDLSKLLINFTNEVLSSSPEQSPSPEALNEHFKICK